MKKLAVLVVLYNCSIENSITIKSILEYENINDIDVVIWNNGPFKLDLNNYGGYFKIIETIENISLSLIYNKFIQTVNAERYVIFDADTSFDSNYLNDLTICEKGKCVTPKIYSGEEQYYPIKEQGFYPFNKRYKCEKSTDLEEAKYVMSIASGLSIDKKIIKEISSVYGDVFDERYKIYGIDTTFFYRASNCKIKFKLMGRMNHSLSRLEVETENKKNFRIRERMIDVGLTLRHYFNLRNVIRCFKYILNNKKRIRNSMLVISVIIRGKHPEVK